MIQAQQPDSAANGTIPTRDFGSILDDLDNFGLTPVQFRIYYHLLTGVDSSGTLSKSIESIAKVCKLTRITVLRVLAQLERMSMIVCDRAAGKKTVFHLQPPSLWHRSQLVENKASSRQCKVVSFPREIAKTKMDSLQQRSAPPTDTLQYKAVHLCQEILEPMSATSKSDIPVNSINSYQSEQVPFRGTCPTVAGANLVSESNQSTADTGNEPELPLDAKLDACRQLGCNIGRVWRNGQMEILVDGLFMSVESFMERKLNSFKENLQPCQAGLNLCRDAIALIKRKIEIAKRNNLEASLT